MYITDIKQRSNDFGRAVSMLCHMKYNNFLLRDCVFRYILYYIVSFGIGVKMCFYRCEYIFEILFS